MDKLPSSHDIMLTMAIYVLIALIIFSSLRSLYRYLFWSDSKYESNQHNDS